MKLEPTAPRKLNFTDRIAAIKEGQTLRISTAGEAYSITGTISRARKKTGKEYTLKRDGDDLLVSIKEAKKGK